MSRSHSHNFGGTQNQGNSIGNKSSIRQSKLFRQYESGNDVKDILGTSNLKWKTEVKQGAYSGKVFDHNAISNTNNQSISNIKTNNNNYNNDASQYQKHNSNYEQQQINSNYGQQPPQQYQQLNNFRKTNNTRHLPSIPGFSKDQLVLIRDENNLKNKADGSTTKRLTDDKKHEIR
jgi:hypothetical protein